MATGRNNNLTILSKSNVLLNETADNLKDFLVPQEELMTNPTANEKVIAQYMETSKLESSLLIGLRSAFEGDIIPKNPYPVIIRSLNFTNLQRMIQTTFSEIIKYVTQNVTEKPSAYGISHIKARPFFFGLPHVLEWVDIEKLAHLRKSIIDVMPDYRGESMNCKLNVTNSLSGGYVFQSQMFPYPDSLSDALEITSEVFVEGGSQETALDVFVKYVYEDVLAITNIQDLHIFKIFVVKLTDPSKRKIEKRWDISQIEAQKGTFISDIKDACLQRNEFYMKILLKTKKLYSMTNRDEPGHIIEKNKKTVNAIHEQAFDKNFQFVNSYKYYNFHYINRADKKTPFLSFTYLPLGSLLRGLFPTEEAAQLYASFFYKENQTYADSKSFKLFTDRVLEKIVLKWKSQDILYVSWECFFIALTVEDEALRRHILDHLIQMLSSDQCKLLAACRINKILQILINAYLGSSIPFYKFAASRIFHEYSEVMTDIIALGTSSPIINFRSFLYALFKGITDDETKLLDLHSDTLATIRRICTITKAIALGNIQLISLVANNVPDFIAQTLEKAKLIDPKKSEYVTYNEIIKKKRAPRVLHISDEIQNNVNKGKYVGADAKIKIEQDLFLNYINEYEVFDYLYIILRELFFEKQVPYPTPVVSQKMEYQSYKFELKEIPSQQLKSLLNEMTPDQMLQFKKQKFANIFVYQSEVMKASNIPAVIGHEAILAVSSVNEISSLKLYLETIDWKKAIPKPPPNYEISDILSISHHSLINHSSIVKRKYVQWVVNLDLIIKGPDYTNATQIFYDSLLKYAFYLEKLADIHVLGFFKDIDTIQPFLEINQALNLANTTKPREMLLNFFAEGKKCVLKFIARLDKNINVKNFNIRFNMHYLNPDTLQSRPLAAMDSIDDMIKVFHKQPDFLLWNKLYPLRIPDAIELAHQKVHSNRQLGRLDNCFKLEIIKYSLESDLKTLIKLFRGLFSPAESFFLIVNEAYNLYHMFAILEKVQKNVQLNKKLELEHTQKLFMDFKSNIESRILVYTNYHLEGIHPKLINILTEISLVYVDKFEMTFAKVKKKLLKVATLCEAIGSSAYLSLESNIFEKQSKKVL